jgi:hypothetical protein
VVRLIEEANAVGKVAPNKRSQICEIGKETSQKVFEGKAAMSQTMLLLCEKGTTRTGLGWASLCQ